MKCELVRRTTGERARLTLSVGVATLDKGLSAQGLIEAAEMCLHAAKRGGRNCVVSEADEKLFAAITGATLPAAALPFVKRLTAPRFPFRGAAGKPFPAEPSAIFCDRAITSDAPSAVRQMGKGRPRAPSCRDGGNHARRPHDPKRHTSSPNSARSVGGTCRTWLHGSAAACSADYRPERHYMRGPGPAWQRQARRDLLL